MFQQRFLPNVLKRVDVDAEITLSVCGDEYNERVCGRTVEPNRYGIAQFGQNCYVGSVICCIRTQPWWIKMCEHFPTLRTVKHVRELIFANTNFLEAFSSSQQNAQECQDKEAVLHRQLDKLLAHLQWDNHKAGTWVRGPNDAAEFYEALISEILSDIEARCLSLREDTEQDICCYNNDAFAFKPTLRLACYTEDDSGTWYMHDLNEATSSWLRQNNITLPNNLVIMIYGLRRRLGTPFEIPLTLDQYGHQLTAAILYSSAEVHYTAIVKEGSGWIKYDGSSRRVIGTEVQDLLNNGAYLLFYYLAARSNDSISTILYPATNEQEDNDVATVDSPPRSPTPPRNIAAVVDSEPRPTRPPSVAAFVTIDGSVDDNVRDVIIKHKEGRKVKRSLSPAFSPVQPTRKLRMDVTVSPDKMAASDLDHTVKWTPMHSSTPVPVEKLDITKSDEDSDMSVTGEKISVSLDRRYFEEQFENRQRKLNNTKPTLKLKDVTGPLVDFHDTSFSDSEKGVRSEYVKNIDPLLADRIRNEIMEKLPNVTWDTIAGLDFAKRIIKETLILPLLRPDLFTKLRSPPKAILLFGPPGTGKTLIGKCIAAQANATFFAISASTITSKWCGEGEKMVRAMFAVARAYQPAVVFMDELDSLLSKRSEKEGDAMRRIKTEFLVQLDGAKTNEDDKILIVGATNRPQEIDEAARRRFVKRLYIPLPDDKARQKIVENMICGEKHSVSSGDLCNIIQRSKGYSGADMANLCSDAAFGPLRNVPFEEIEHLEVAKIRPIGYGDFCESFNNVKPTVSPNDLTVYMEWNNQFGSSSH